MSTYIIDQLVVLASSIDSTLRQLRQRVDAVVTDRHESSFSRFAWSVSDSVGASGPVGSQWERLVAETAQFTALYKTLTPSEVEEVNDRIETHTQYLIQSRQLTK
jgi:hypothetical protein